MKLSIRQHKGKVGGENWLEYMIARKIQREVQDGEWFLHRNMGQTHILSRKKRTKTRSIFSKQENTHDWVGTYL